jgi:uncharacterized membrane protein
VVALTPEQWLVLALIVGAFVAFAVESVPSGIAAVSVAVVMATIGRTVV